jgi:hypothetical protein
MQTTVIDLLGLLARIKTLEDDLDEAYERIAELEAEQRKASTPASPDCPDCPDPDACRTSCAIRRGWQRSP